MKTLLRAILIVVLLLAGRLYGGELEVLKQLKPLPLKAYWFDKQADWANADPVWREEIARICGTRCARLEKLTPETAKVLVEGKQAIGLNCSPHFPEGQGAWTPETLDALKRLMADCERANKLLDGRDVSAVLVDFESWRASNARGVARLQAVHDVIAEAFPRARQYWYQTGNVEWLHGWQINEYGASEIRPPLPNTCTLYQGGDYFKSLQKLFRNVESAKARTQPLVPIVALGAGYIQCLGLSPNGKVHTATSRWEAARLPDYAVYMLGAALCQPSCDPPDFPEHVYEAICLYPGPGDRRWPDWERNFVQFCHGAQSQLLPDDLRD